jgi:fibronectin type 3 domain-containing protein
MMAHRSSQTKRRAGAVRALWLAVAFAVAQTGCTTIPDFERARRFFDRPTEPPAPELLEGTGADLPGPDGLSAEGGVLRVVPLQWEPLLTRDVGGYVIERAPSRDGRFVRLATVAGAHSTSYIDDLATSSAPAAPTDAAEPPPSAPIDVAAASPAEAAVPPPHPNGLDAATYYYRVRAFNRAGELAATPSDVVSATTAAPPTAPGDLRAYSHRPRKVPLSWHTSPDPTVSGYRIERSPTSLGPFEPLAAIEGRHQTHWVDQPLGDLRVFYYRILAVNEAGGEGPPSEPVRAVTKPEPLPPIGLRVTESRLGTNQLTWEPNVEPDVVQYHVLRQRTDGRSEVFATLPPWSLQAIDSEIGAGETVGYRLVAYDGDGLISEPSEAITVQSEGYGLRAATGPEGVRLEWYPRDDEGYAGARVYRHGALRQREFPPVSASEFTDGEVVAGGRYVYSVSLLDAEGRPAPRSLPVEVSIPADWQPNPSIQR